MTKQTLAGCLLLSLCLISTADSVAIFAANHNLIDHRNARVISIINSSMQLPPISGYSGGDEIVQVSSSDQTGYVVRYTSAHCPYCKRDESAWLELAHIFQKHGFSVIKLVPRSTDAHVFRGGSSTYPPEISFISTAWLERVRLDVTPAIVAVSAHGIVIWSHKGTLAPDDIAAATQAVAQGTR
jgi:glutaredoxin